MSTTPISVFGDPSQLWSIPPEDVMRQATASLRGYVYQLHASATAWLELREDDELYLEVAEDFTELLREPGKEDVLRATQVKDTRESGAVTLNSPDVLAAIESLHRLRACNRGREVRFVFLTTSRIGKERKDALPSGVAGLTAWEAAASGGDVRELRAALLQRTLSEELRAFVTNSVPEQLRSELLSPMVFACGAQDWQSLEESNRRAIVSRREQFRSTADMAYRAYDAVFRDAVACALGPAPRSLNGKQLQDCLERATSLAIPSSVAVGLLPEHVNGPSTALSIDELRDLAESLIDTGAPPSIDLLFPGAKAEAKDALVEAFLMEPRLSEIKFNGAPTSASLSDLIALPEKKHLIVGQPGSGKTHALWHAANKLLAADTIIPLYLPAGHAAGWQDLEEMITEAAPGVKLTTLLQDPRVCVFVDSWSDLAGAGQVGEKRRALRALRSVRLVATAKFADIDDSTLKQWTLELLPPDRVMRTVAAATPGEALPSNSVIDLLRLPLLLAIHVLSNARSTTTGDLLRQFHDHLMRGLPERFTEILAGAAADLSLAGTRSFGRLMDELQTRATKVGITDPARLLRSLGTILERDGQAIPFHELYWSWLTGRGLLGDAVAKRAVGLLRTRESYALAIQSGGRAAESDVNAAVSDDIVLAAALDVSRGEERPIPALTEALSRALADSRLAVRNRAAIAALEGGHPEFLRPALEVLADLERSSMYPSEWKQALRPKALYMQRATLADWLGAPNSSLVLDVIAEGGGPEWSLWLEQVAADGRIGWAEAAATALGCCSDVPQWVRPHLDTLVASHAWLLRPAAARRGNRALARVIAIEYERLVESVVDQNSSGWFELNRVLVGCGGDDVFDLLLSRFPSMGPRAQELLGFAVVERGSPWVSRFQRVALLTGAPHHHRLAKELSLEIDDETARTWITAGHDAAGWRILIARHGEDILPEMIRQLPLSFAGIHRIPTLTYMRWLPSAPVTLIDEVWRRLGSPMQPKAMEDVLNAIARVYPVGVLHIVKFIAEQPHALSGYHLRQALLLYQDWQKRSGIVLGVKTTDGIERPFSDWIAHHSVVNQWEDHFTPELLALSPELAIDYIVHALDDERAASVLKALKGVAVYSAPLLNRMLAVPTLAALIPQVFAEGFDQFPIDALRQCIASGDIDQDTLLYRLAATANPLHRAVHEELIKRVLACSPKWHNLRYVADMLRAYSRGEVLQIIDALPHVREDCWFWFVRLVENTRGERLINEDGSLRHY
ncbi:MULTISPECIES: hypothetical protein [Pseudomonas]|uniref:Uncharacterized protein n=2 Tax=Pseudomonas TaxID=286 RepID=A0A2X2CDV4_PSELU|nr:MULTISPECIES: hypothetical protein [Pseudomonas]SER21300.1 hypothetical protein SAMN05216409_11428 [Pseudomonas lutea]SPZ04911.1 Uncharacterised protein [Pseudomonas luteola]